MKTERLVISTDAEDPPTELPDDLPCPRCKAGPDRRATSGGFGANVRIICGTCGYDLGPRGF